VQVHHSPFCSYLSLIGTSFCRIKDLRSIVTQGSQDLFLFIKNQVYQNFFLHSLWEWILFLGMLLEPILNILSPSLADMLPGELTVDPGLVKGAGDHTAIQHSKQAGVGVGIAIVGCSRKEKKMLGPGG